MSINWSSDAGTGKALDDDVPYVVVYNRNSKKSFGFVMNIEREDEFVNLPLPDDEFGPGNVIDVWLAFLRADGTVVFETAYATTTIDTVA